MWRDSLHVPHLLPFKYNSLEEECVFVNWQEIKEEDIEHGKVIKTTEAGKLRRIVKAAENIKQHHLGKRQGKKHKYINSKTTIILNENQKHAH